MLSAAKVELNRINNHFKNGLDVEQYIQNHMIQMKAETVFSVLEWVLDEVKE